MRQLLNDYPDLPPGRVVTLGTPHQGSYVARRFDNNLVGRVLLGHSRGVLTEQDHGWSLDRELGVIAGSRSVGVGLLVPGLAKPNDGTVAVVETRLEGMSDHLVLVTTHMGLLGSAEAAAQCCHFLKNGDFFHDSDTP
ncbi:hypothetical protein [Candidatus Reidiella endopervernicosa]|uniref:Uncharacterized protein n=1 Tax=Candidatus Reidiella endopervernicosa TaxID=2738883 RepID=A0A6N0HYP9_9GAMM|nr:hypothetical protein [Candidatus Reidiella endopervernicosa]QKQ27472.1 hypothetical protein HUE57_15160 [Candidatus Reidiella endopervernicosa]